MNNVPAQSFRARLQTREPLLGTFLKTPSAHHTEILGSLGFDFVVVDQEHAPFDRTTTDMITLAARAWNIAPLVRIRCASDVEVLGPLDDGAQGLIIPHVSSAEVARRMVAAARYRGGSRGFSNSPRAGRYGELGFWEHVDTCDALTTVIAMIEDPAAIADVDAIASVPGLDALFIGRGDLTIALGAAGPQDDIIKQAVERITDSARRHDKPVLVHAGRIDPAEFQWLRSLGVSGFIVSSDQGLMRAAAVDVLQQFRAQVR